MPASQVHYLSGQVASSDKVAGKRRAHSYQNGHANGGPNSLQAPFECTIFDQKLQHAGLEELEAMHRSVLKRQKMVLDRLLDLGEGKLKSEGGAEARASHH